MLVIERLTLGVFLRWPVVVWWNLTRREKVCCCYIIDGPEALLRAGRVVGQLAGVVVERLAFRMIDVRDKEGLLLRERIPYRDMAEMEAEVIKEPIFRDWLAELPGRRMASYVTKSIVETEMREYNTLGRALLLVQVAIWKARALGRVGRPLLLLERRPWSAAIGRYAKRQGVSIMTVTAVHLSRLSVRGLLGPWGVAFVRALRGRLWHWCFLRTRKSAHYTTRTRRGETKLCAKLAVPYQGQFNLNSPEMHSDLFFWHQSDLSSHDLLLLFEFEQDPLDQTKWNELSDCGIEGLALYPGATTVADVPFFTHLPGFRKAHVKGMDSTKGASLEAKWFRQTVCSYELDREYWTELFLQRGIKVYLTWRHFDARYKAIPEALEDLGGVSAAYQRSCQPDAGPHKKVDIDLMFGFGRIDGEVERSSGSVIPYHVTVGYFGDHRFPLLRNDAAALRLKLQRRGAEYIVAFFDENSGWDTYVNLLMNTPFLLWMKNSLIVSSVVTIMGVSLASTSAYALSRFQFRGRNFGMISLLVTQMFPATMLLLPFFIILSKLSLINSFMGLIIIYSSTALPFCIWQMKGYYDTIPPSLEESAFLDGCNHLKVGGTSRENIDNAHGV